MQYNAYDEKVSHRKRKSTLKIILSSVREKVVRRKKTTLTIDEESLVNKLGNYLNFN